MSVNLVREKDNTHNYYYLHLGKLLSKKAILYDGKGGLRWETGGRGEVNTKEKGKEKAYTERMNSYTVLKTRLIYYVGVRRTMCRNRVLLFNKPYPLTFYASITNLELN